MRQNTTTNVNLEDEAMAGKKQAREHPEQKQGVEEESDMQSFMDWMEAEGIRPLAEGKTRVSQAKRKQPAIEIREGWKKTSKRRGAVKPREEIEQVGPLASLQYFHSHVSLKARRQFKRGSLRMEHDVDLHGLNWKEAQRELRLFLEEIPEGRRSCALVIHGKAHGAVLGRATMKSMAFHYLKHHPRVLGIVSALPKDGGLGAVYILVE